MKDKNNVSLQGMFSHYNSFTQSDMNDHHKEMYLFHSGTEQFKILVVLYKFTL